MGVRGCWALIAASCVFLAGCAATAPRVEDTLALLRRGAAEPTCREACVSEWRRVQPEAAQLDAGGRGAAPPGPGRRAGCRGVRSRSYLRRGAVVAALR